MVSRELVSPWRVVKYPNVSNAGSSSSIVKSHRLERLMGGPASLSWSLPSPTVGKRARS